MGFFSFQLGLEKYCTWGLIPLDSGTNLNFQPCFLISKPNPAQCFNYIAIHFLPLPENAMIFLAFMPLHELFLLPRKHNFLYLLG